MYHNSRKVFGLTVAQAVSQGPRFDPTFFHVMYVMDKAILRQFSISVLRFSPLNIIRPNLHTHSNHSSPMLYSQQWTASLNNTLKNCKC
jgi:hypothetical protein